MELEERVTKEWLNELLDEFLDSKDSLEALLEKYERRSQASNKDDSES